MISGGLEQYVETLLETKINDSSIKQEISLVCPCLYRMEVLEDLWKNNWEITRSGPITENNTDQLIRAFKIRQKEN